MRIRSRPTRRRWFWF